MTVVEIGTLGHDRKQSAFDYWLRRTVDQGDSQTVSWTDSRTCPAVRTILMGMRDLPMPTFAPPGFDDHREIILDGVSFSLRGPASGYHAGGQLSIQTNTGTPLAAWIENSLKALEGCWSSKVPKRTVG